MSSAPKVSKILGQTYTYSDKSDMPAINSCDIAFFLKPVSNAHEVLKNKKQRKLIQACQSKAVKTFCSTIFCLAKKMFELNLFLPIIGNGPEWSLWRSGRCGLVFFCVFCLEFSLWMSIDAHFVIIFLFSALVRRLCERSSGQRKERHVQPIQNQL